MTDHLRLTPHDVQREDRDDGTILLRSGIEVGRVERSVGAWLQGAAAQLPDRVFLAERDGNGWREVTYEAALREVVRIAAALLDMGLGADRPIMILSGNSIDHAMLALAAQFVGVPYAPVAEQYSLIPAARGRLDYAVGLIEPALVYAEDGAAYADALALPCMKGRQIMCSRNAPDGAKVLGDLEGSASVSDAFEAVGADTVAKYLLTSGSTSDPKAVVTTHGMLTVNQAMVRPLLPFLQDQPLVMVDWLPWNHTFGGSFNFNCVLSSGGTMYIDDGKPLPALFPRTVENLSRVPATLSCNVPVGFAQLVQALRVDRALAEVYFRDLKAIFYAGASLPQEVWAALEELAREVTGRVPLITSAWGLTETAPSATMQHEPAKGAGVIGVPMPGVTLKLVPDDEGRLDVRVKAPSVFGAYLKDPERTSQAFDDEGFFVSGDAMVFADPDDMNAGLRFDGRMSEDFKLMTGTWVRAANLRLEVLAALAPLAQDVVLTGEGRAEVGALIVPNRAACETAGFELAELGGVLLSAPLQARLAEVLAGFKGSGSAGRVARALVMAEPPDMGQGEVTAKGNLNFARLLERRADLVDLLYGKDQEGVIYV